MMAIFYITDYIVLRKALCDQGSSFYMSLASNDYQHFELFLNKNSNDHSAK